MPDAADFETSRPYTVTLPETESHHISRVMRLGAGDAIVIFNGLGASWNAAIEKTGKRATATITSIRTPLPPPPARLTLAIGLLKGEAMDDVVGNATALGVAEIIPMVTKHAVVPKRQLALVGGSAAGKLATGSGRWRQTSEGPVHGSQAAPCD